MNARREDWRTLNSLESCRPLVTVNWGRFFTEVPELAARKCEDPDLHEAEAWLRRMNFCARLDDDTVFERWIPCRAVFACTGWGLSQSAISPEMEKGATKIISPIKDLSDLSGLEPPRHEIDEDATARKAGKLRDAVGDLLEVDVDRSPYYLMWPGDLSTVLGHLRGIEPMMMDMYDQPEKFHTLMAFLRDGVLRAHEEAEAAGDWGLSAHQNQSETYSRELPDPAPNRRGVKRKDLWGFSAAQEFALVGPEQHEAFLLEYQLPILSAFGLTAYGCCEDLTRKIGMLRRIPNLRRIAVAPTADIERCAEGIGSDYVISYRPNPAEMVCVGFDEARIRRMIGRALEVFDGLHVEILLKDIDTCQNEPSRIADWVRIVRDVIEKIRQPSG